MKKIRHHFLTIFLLFVAGIFTAQGQSNIVNIGSDCGTITDRNNGNGKVNTCPGVNNTAVAPNFVNTPYATVPTGTKHGDIHLQWVVSGTLYPPVIKRIFESYNGLTVLTNLQVGPAGLPTQSGNVLYCIYNPTNYNLNTWIPKPTRFWAIVRLTLRLPIQSAYSIGLCCRAISPERKPFAPPGIPVHLGR
jgi:hypothetical protein